MHGSKTIGRLQVEAGVPAAGRRMSRSLRFLAFASVASMFLVLLMGALVTNSGSAEGCGASWPLCAGKFLPQNNIHSVIEYSHRAVSGIAGMLITLFAVWGGRVYRDRREVPILLGTAVFFVFLQAALGAAAVLWPQPDLVLALHFGISLTAFAAVLLPTVIMLQLEHGGTGRLEAVAARVRRLIWWSAIYIYAVVYSGAYVRHTNSHLACLDWPLCNGAIIPQLSGAVGIQFFHRLAAGVGLFLLCWLAWEARKVKERRPDIYKGAIWAAALIGAQVLAGAYLILSHLTLTSMMLHSALITLLFGVLSYLCLQALPEPHPKS